VGRVTNPTGRQYFHLGAQITSPARSKERNLMPKYEYDAKLSTTIIVTADDEDAAEKKAAEILNRMTIQDPQNPDENYGVDTEDGVELFEELYDEDEENDEDDD
jgi:hypothetical protein